MQIFSPIAPLERKIRAFEVCLKLPRSHHQLQSTYDQIVRKSYVIKKTDQTRPDAVARSHYTQSSTTFRLVVKKIDCVICSGRIYEDNKVVETLPCTHAFHPLCIAGCEITRRDEVANVGYGKCPLCRNEYIVTPSVRDFTGFQNEVTPSIVSPTFIALAPPIATPDLLVSQNHDIINLLPLHRCSQIGHI